MPRISTSRPYREVQLRDTVGNQDLSAGTPGSPIKMIWDVDDSDAEADLEDFEVDLANDRIKLKTVGWYRAWASFTLGSGTSTTFQPAFKLTIAGATIAGSTVDGMWTYTPLAFPSSTTPILPVKFLNSAIDQYLEAWGWELSATTGTRLTAASRNFLYVEKLT